MWDGWYMGGTGGGFFLLPLAMMLIGLAWLLLLLWVIYDVATRRDMQVAEKVLWVVVALTLNIIGPLLYILVVKVPGEPVFRGGRAGLSELERIADLHERGALGDEEYAELKEEYLERLRE